MTFMEDSEAFCVEMEGIIAPTVRLCEQLLLGLALIGPQSNINTRK